MPGVSLVVGNSHKHRLAQIALREGIPHLLSDSPLITISPLHHSDNRLFVSDIFAHTEFLASPVIRSISAIFISVFAPISKFRMVATTAAPFCVIPYVRGQSRSLPLPEGVLREVSLLVQFRVSRSSDLGDRFGRWGRDIAPDATGGPRFEDLVRAILNEIFPGEASYLSVEPDGLER